MISSVGYWILLCLALLMAPSQATARNTPKLVGGEPALPGEFPFQVSVRNIRFGHTCGGAILSPQLVVTAGVCTAWITDPINSVEVAAGSLKRSEDNEWRQVRKVNRSVVHPGYNASTMDNDLSLLFLAEPFDFNENVSAVHLPPALVETFPKPVILSGWGNVQYGEPLFEDLQKVTLDTYSDAVCEERAGQYVRPEILCTGGDEGGRGSCQGDAGGPLVMDFGSNNTVLAAVVSHFPCPLPDCCGTPGPNDQNTQLSYYIEWILEQSRLYGGGL